MRHTIRLLFAAALRLACSLAAAQTYSTKLVRIVVPFAVGGAADGVEMTFEAIATSRFYVFPHPKIRKNIQTRVEDILELRNPTRTV